MKNCISMLLSSALVLSAQAATYTDMNAVFHFLNPSVGGPYMRDMDFYRYFLSGMSENEDLITTDCLVTFFSYRDRFNYLVDYTASRVGYNNGRNEKGNGEPTAAGAWLDKVVLYMDITVLFTNLWNYCKFDYYMQKVGTSLTSLSGALDLFTNFMFRYLSTDDTQLYSDLSDGLDAEDRAIVGLQMGKFMKLLFVTEIPDVSYLEPEKINRVETVIQD